MGKHHAEKTVNITTGSLPNSYELSPAGISLTAAALTSLTARTVLSVRARLAEKNGKQVSVRSKNWATGLRVVSGLALAGQVALQALYARRVKEQLRDQLLRAGLPADRILAEGRATTLHGVRSADSSAGWVSRNCAYSGTGTLVDVHVIITPVSHTGERAVEIITTPASAE